MVYPTDYGFLMGHRGRDGDPLDAMVCVSEPTFPGCVIPVKPIALFKMQDEKGEDDKVVCVPTHDPGWNTAETLDDIPEAMQREITHFFSVYKQLEGKQVEVDGWRSREEALEVIADGSPAADGARRAPAELRRRAGLPARGHLSTAARNPTEEDVEVQDRGLAAYIAELFGTLFLVFVDRHAWSRLFVSTGANA